MEKVSWTGSEIRKLFRMDERYKSHQTLYNAEDRGDIPKAHRVARGKVMVRNWSLEQLPKIGEKFGFLKKRDRKTVICKYIQKGGVLKTTTSFNEAKTFALNGMKTLIIGLDFECSITDVVLPEQEVLTLEDSQPQVGLFHLLAEGASLSRVVRKTSIPTLDIIPETHDLVQLEKWLNQQKRREYIFIDKLMPLLSDYDVVIFDNGPSWNHLIENALVASDVILCPLGCNLLAYNASETNIHNIFDFEETMNLVEEKKVIMFPTLLDRTSLSQQIYAEYIARFSKYLVTHPIRVSAKWQESLMNKQTIIEYAPTSQAAHDYYDLIRDIWNKIDRKDAKSKHEEIAQKQAIGG